MFIIHCKPTSTVICSRGMSFLLALSIFISLKTALCDDEHLINTKNGLVRGKAVTAPNGKSVKAFLGIPYAQPPVGVLRYRAPLPAQQWQGVFNASSNFVGCMQLAMPASDGYPVFEPFRPSGNYSEDCLKLDVWTPNPKPNNAAVLVFIYGGAFILGSTNAPGYVPVNWVSEHNVVHVSMNYRLGSFGFLYFDHPETPGNLGLLDQALALRWVKDNIQAFGGDPTKVTIYGQSAGSASVGFHLLSPVSNELFNNAILQSGTPTSPWASQTKNENIEMGLKLAKGVGCPSDLKNISATINCLRNISAEELVMGDMGVMVEVMFLAFLPLVDGIFIPSNQGLSFRNTTTTKKNIILGTVMNEASIFLFGLNMIALNEDDLLKMMSRTTSSKYPLLTKSAKVQYTNWRDPKNIFNIAQNAERMASDYVFNCPVLALASDYSGSENHVYQYLFAHKTQNLTLPESFGVHHMHDLYYTFGGKIHTNHHLLDVEMKLCQRIRSYWVNFANTGNPNLCADGKRMSVTWPEFNNGDKKYLVLSPGSTTVGSHFHVQKCAFWREIFPLLIEEALKSQTEDSVLSNI